MNAEVKQKWIDALRSGKYNQTKGCLHDNTGYCCLGVLCDVVDPNGWDKGDGFRETIWNYKEEVDDLLLPPTLVEDLDIDEDAPVELSDMNDNGTPFAEIADYIDKNL